MKFFFLALLILHGLIHLMGFTKEFNFAPMSALSGETLFPITKGLKPLFGSLGLLACLLFLGAALFYFLQKDTWWMFAFVGILLSQVLIIIYWQDAKAGTVANLIILIVALVGFGTWKHHNLVRREIKEIFASQTTKNTEIVSENDLTNLPTAVQNWLRKSGVLGKPKYQKVHLWQKGKMRPKTDGNWLETTAEQHFRIDEPTFVWDARVQMMPGIHLTGRDKLQDGKGNMLIKILGLYTIVDGKGEKIDQGTLLRYLGEMVWFPSAALSPYISWEDLGENKAKATLNWKDLEVSGIFEFDESGRQIRFSADRFYGTGEAATLEKWYVPTKEWTVFNGIRVPSKGDVFWDLPTGPYNYFEWEITKIEYE